MGVEGYKNGHPGMVRLIPDRLEDPLHWKKPRRVFVNSMSDLFHEDIPFDFIDQVFAVMALADKHTFMVLTKRAARMREYFGPSPELDGITRDCLVEGTAQKIYHRRTGENPDMWLAVHWPLENVELGVSVESPKYASERIPALMDTPAARRFVSYEPALAATDFSPWLPLRCCNGTDCGCMGKPINPPPYIDQIIAGGESGPNARPSKLDWFRKVRDVCTASGTAFFFKQIGEWAEVQIEEDESYYGGTAFDHPLGGRASGFRAKPFIFEDASKGYFVNIGKKRAGRLLDGREWNEFPK
jgi:protein gp37